MEKQNPTELYVFHESEIMRTHKNVFVRRFYNSSLKEPIYIFSSRWTYLIHLWAEAIKTLHNLRCTICGRGFKSECFMELDSHHILPRDDFPHYALEIWNGMLLCKHHHGMAERLYHSHKSNISEYFNQLILLIHNNHYSGGRL